MALLPYLCFGDEGQQGLVGRAEGILPCKEPHSTSGVLLLIAIPHPQANLSFLDFLSHNVFHLHRFPFCFHIYPPVIFCAFSVLLVLYFPLLMLLHSESKFSKLCLWSNHCASYVLVLEFTLCLLICFSNRPLYLLV